MSKMWWSQRDHRRQYGGALLAGLARLHLRKHTLAPVRGGRRGRPGPRRRARGRLWSATVPDLWLQYFITAKRNFSHPCHFATTHCTKIPPWQMLHTCPRPIVVHNSSYWRFTVLMLLLPLKIRASAMLLFLIAQCFKIIWRCGAS
jgi:hypothetical protein